MIAAGTLGLFAQARQRAAGPCGQREQHEGMGGTAYHPGTNHVAKAQGWITPVDATTGGIK